MSTPMLSRDEMDRRITFHDDEEIMEVDFDSLNFENSVDVNSFYDRLEERVAATGEQQWFFLINYCKTRIDSSAWFAFSRRGKELNLAHSMGSARFDASEITRKQIERAGGNENFDPGLFFDREGAIEKLRSLPSKRTGDQGIGERSRNFPKSELTWRIEFHAEDQIMEADFSNMSFEHSQDVDDVYDFVEQQIAATERKWYFLVNYSNTKIQSPAWVQYAARGKKLNETWSLGSVRFAPGSETETDIRLRAESQGFRPNIRNTREEALERIAEMKAEAGAN